MNQSQNPNLPNSGEINIIVRIGFYITRKSRKFMNALKTPPKMLYFVAVTAGTLVIYIFLALILYFNVVNLCNRWGNNIKYYSQIKILSYGFLTEQKEPLKTQQLYNIDRYLKRTTKIKNQTQKQRIKDQVYTIRYRATTNLRMARDLYCYMIIFTTLLFGSTIVSGLCAYSMTKKGWDDTNDTIKGIFITSLAVSLFSTSTCSVYQLEKNSRTKMQTYQAYVNLEEYIFSCLAVEDLLDDQTKPEKGNQKNVYPNNLISRINQVLETYPLQVDLDSTSIPRLSTVLESVDINSKKN